VVLTDPVGGRESPVSSDPDERCARDGVSLILLQAVDLLLDACGRASAPHVDAHARLQRLSNHGRTYSDENI
jgi:hypothetical protein